MPKRALAILEEDALAAAPIPDDLIPATSRPRRRRADVRPKQPESLERKSPRVWPRSAGCKTSTPTVSYHAPVGRPQVQDPVWDSSDYIDVLVGGHYEGRGSATQEKWATLHMQSSVNRE